MCYRPFGQRRSAPLTPVRKKDFPVEKKKSGPYRRLTQRSWSLYGHFFRLVGRGGVGEKAVGPFADTTYYLAKYHLENVSHLPRRASAQGVVEIAAQGVVEDPAGGDARRACHAFARRRSLLRVRHGLARPLARGRLQCYGRPIPRAALHPCSRSGWLDGVAGVALRTRGVVSS